MFIISAMFFQSAKAADITEVTPLTDKILMLHFDEGSMTYPTDLNVSRLNTDDASVVTSYALVSNEDNDFSDAVNPDDLGRKSKGMEFVSNSGVPWGGSSFDPTGKPWVTEHWIYLEFETPMKTGYSYTLHTGDLAENGSEWTFIFDEKQHRSEAVHVNTLGYAPDKPKYGYVYQWMGDKGNLDLSEYEGNTFSVYAEGETHAAMQGTLVFKAAADNPETGQPNDTPDRNFLGAEVYECDFSSLTEPGNYFLAVEGIGRSFPFKIGEDPVFEAYYHGARSLYHQRSGIRLEPPYTEEGYIRPVTQNTEVISDDGTDFSGKLLYCTLPYVEWDQGENGGSSQEAIREASIGNPLDVAGWYHDAGDWDGYFSHQRVPVLLMLTYEAFPERFTDGDLNIPESGNGIPDLVDEASWLLKFNYRLKKELINKGYSDGGIGGARVAPDFFNSVDGNAQSDKPSWQDYRRYVVSNADAYMTYLYAGQAAQFAYILKSLGKNPESFLVEMLDDVDFENMTHDEVNWISEAEYAFQWASDPDNQPATHAHYSSELWVYKMYAATSLYRITGDETYHNIAKEELEKIRNKNPLDEDERYGAYLYLLTHNNDVDKTLQASLKNVCKKNADWRGKNASEIRGLRWGGIYDMPMLIGQGTTPWMFENIFAYAVTQDKTYANVAHQTADYFLGNNPLHTTWMTGVGPRPARGGFHLDSRYLWDNNWMVYKGFVPYGPWSMNYGYNPFSWVIDGVEMEGGAGPWNKDWANFSVYPFMHEWPGHERYNNNIHAPMSTENTIHQQSVYLAIAYGFANNRQNNNADAPIQVGSVELDQTEIIFENPGDQAILNPALDVENASFPALKWESSDPRIAHVDGYGRVTGVTSGTATITCSVLDGSVSATAQVTCNWEDTAVNSISISPDEITMVEGQKVELTITFDPQDATNQFVDWSYSEDGIAQVDENNMLVALATGSVKVYATSMQDQKTDSVQVEVMESVDHVIADFDEIIPVTTEPQPDTPQMYFPGGTGEIDAINPLQGTANNSELVALWNRPEGSWRLFGMVLPTDFPQNLASFSQFQFKFFGDGIETLHIQLKTVEESEIEATIPVEGENCWKLFTLDLNSSLNLKQFNIFVNPTGDTLADMYHFDDFMLTVEEAVYFEDLTISNNSLEMESGETFQLTADNQGNPFTWVTDNQDVATVDQNGMVTAVGGGTGTIKAVPLYGNTVECEVIVNGGTQPPEDQKMILDFQAIEFNWSPYGSYAWASNQFGITENPEISDENNSSKTYFWYRDGTNNWGGYGIQFPQEETADWESFSFQLYPVKDTIQGVRFELLLGEESISDLEADNLGILPKTWGTVNMDISDFVNENTNYSRIIVQPHKGTAVEDTVYFDNFMMKMMPYIAVSGIETEGEQSYQLEVEETLQLQAHVVPENATNTNLLWESDQPTIASVTENGLVTAINEGTAVITISAEDDPEIQVTIEIIVSEGTGIIVLEHVNLEIFPNPAHGFFTVKTTQNIQKIELMNHLGKIIHVQEGENNKELKISNSIAHTGIYFIRVTFTNGMVSSHRKIFLIAD